MKKSCPLILAVAALVALVTGCESIDTSVFGGSFGRNSTAMTAGGAVAGQDYVIGLKPSEAAQQYFASASASDAKTVTVTPGDDKGTGVTWTDDGGITIPPGVTIEFVNKGCCLDPHLPAPKADEEMQFIKTSCLIPTQLQGTYKNLLRRAAAGDEDVKSNLQHLMWTLRTAGSNDAYAKNLTDRQREILAECAEAGSFDGYCQDLHRFDELKKLVMAQVGQVTDKLQVEIGNVTYKVTDLLDPELGKQKVAAHLGELIHMNEYLPVVHSGFNYGELQKGIYTDIKGNGTLSYKAKVANSTSEPFVFYPMDYVAQVGSGQNMQGAFFAAADNSMKQRQTQCVPEQAEAKEDENEDCSDWHRRKKQECDQIRDDINVFQYWLELDKKAHELRTAELMSLPWWVRNIHQDLSASTIGAWKGVLFWSCFYNPAAGLAINAGDGLVRGNMDAVSFDSYYDLANEIGQDVIADEIIRRNEKVMRMGGKVTEYGRDNINSAISHCDNNKNYTRLAAKVAPKTTKILKWTGKASTVISALSTAKDLIEISKVHQQLYDIRYQIEADIAKYEADIAQLKRVIQEAERELARLTGERCGICGKP